MTIEYFHNLIDKNEINLFHFVTSNEIDADTLILRDKTKDNLISEDIIEKLSIYIKTYCELDDLKIKKSNFFDKASSQGLMVSNDRIIIDLNSKKKFDLIMTDSLWNSVKLNF